MCEITLSRTIRKRNIFIDIIPTVCNLRNMLTHLTNNNGDITKLKSWHLRSYYGYNIEPIKAILLISDEKQRIKIIREHILIHFPANIGKHFVDVCLVAYASQNGVYERPPFRAFLEKIGVKNEGSRNAICQVGFGDGIYLQLLHQDGSIKDCDFFKQLLVSNTP